MLVLASSLVSGVLIACVSDTRSVVGGTDSGSGADTGTPSDDASAPSEASSQDAPPACEVRKKPGVSCFPVEGDPKDCDSLLEICCVALKGGNQLVGSCTKGNLKGDAAIATCQGAEAVLWECDSAPDCPSGGSVCCVPNLFKVKDQAVCPIILDVDEAGQPPNDGKATRCRQPACGPNEITACKKDADCSQTERCSPASLQGKLFGLCIPR